MFEFQIGDDLELEDGTYTVEGLLGGNVRLRRHHDQQVDVLHVSALLRAMVLPRRMDPGIASPRSLDRLTEKQRHRVDALARHIEEVIFGAHRDQSDPRPEYDLRASTQGERVGRKIAEMSAAGSTVSARTFNRWIALYKAGGPAALVDLREERASSPLGHLDSRVRDALIAVIVRRTDLSTVTTKKLAGDAREEVLRRHPGEGVPLPSERTLRRCIDVLQKGRHTTGTAATRRSAANTPKRMFDSRPAIAPGHEVQVDSSPFDVFALGDDGKPLRAKLTIMLDKATQSIIATSVNVGGTKGVDLAFMLAQCLTPRPARPDGGRLPNETELRHMPWAQGLTADEIEQYDLTRPFIKPHRIMIDNGKDYRSDVFVSACEQFGIDLTLSAVRTPTDKPNVERAFHTIKTMLLEHLPGYTAGSVSGRGRNPESEDLLDIYTLAELVDRWVSVVWQNMRHEALRDPVHPNVVHTPNSMYMAMFDMTGFVPVPLTEDDYIALLPTQQRTIQTDGIQMNYRRYDSVHLNPYRLQPDPTTGSPRWWVHYNPHNPAAVWVRDPETMLWIACAWMNKDAFDKPFSAAIRRTAREVTAAQGALGDIATTQATVELIAQTRAAQAAKVREEIRRQTSQKLGEVTGKRLPVHIEPVRATEEEADVDGFEFEVFDPSAGFK